MKNSLVPLLFVIVIASFIVAGVVAPITSAATSPTVSNVTFGNVSPVETTVSGGETIYGLTIGTHPVNWRFSDFNFNLYDQGNLSGKVRQVAIMVCNPNTSACLEVYRSATTNAIAGFGNYDFVVGERLWSRLTDPAKSDYLRPYYDGVYTRIKVCPVFSEGSLIGQVPSVAVCAWGPRLKVIQSNPNPPVTIAPTINTVTVAGLADHNQWFVGETHRVSWTFSGFGGQGIFDDIPKKITTVSFSICHPSANRCFVAPTATTVLNLVSSGGGQNSGSAFYDLRVGLKMYDVLTPGTSDYNSSFAPYYDNYRYQIKICPTYSADPSNGSPTGNGEIVANSICAKSPVLQIAKPGGTTIVPPSIETDTEFNTLPAGQFCTVGECVCYNGKRIRCAHGMGSYSPEATSCPKCGTATTASASFAGRLLGAVIWPFNSWWGLLDKK